MSEFWLGFIEALDSVNTEIDKFLATGYNEARIKDELLDLKCRINELRELPGEIIGSVPG